MTSWLLSFFADPLSGPVDSLPRGARMASVLSVAGCLALALMGWPSVGRATTPTPTATPQRTGDLGTKEVRGKVHDLDGGNAGIAGASVSYSSPRDSGTVATGAHGDFTFSLFLHDTDRITVNATAPGYQNVQLYFGGYELWTYATLGIGLMRADDGGHRVWGLVHRDPYCSTEAQVRVVLEPLAGDAETTRVLVLPPSNEFAFDGVPDGDYTLRAESDCQPSYAPPGAVYVRGGDVYEELAFDAQCPPVVVVEPPRGPPGTAVELSGRCSRIHSGGQANLSLDAEPVTTTRAGTIGDYRALIRIPATARPGLHYIQVTTTSGRPIASGTFFVEPDVAAVCAGDCDADGRVEIDELITGVRITLHTTAASCPAFARDQYGEVSVAEIVAAVGNALHGCGSQ